ncbi:MAG TPA: sulfotransferase [Tepidisphaeraceae bacterium]|nr:sulfotransferase [Tepidisphaeraceae bacterium]
MSNRGRYIGFGAAGQFRFQRLLTDIMKYPGHAAVLLPGGMGVSPMLTAFDFEHRSHGPDARATRYITVSSQQLFGTISWMPCLPLAQSRDRAIAEAMAGDRLFDRLQFAAALEHYKAAIRLMPENPLFHHKAGYAAWRCDLGAFVEQCFLEAVRLDPDFAPAHSMLGQWYRYTARPELALQHSQRAVSLDPQNPDFVVSRALVLESAGREADAWETVQPVLANPRVGERIAILYARIARRIGREQEALEWIERHLKQSGPPPQERPELHFLLAAMLERMGRYDEAFEHATTAHRLFHREFDMAAHRAAIDRKIEFCTRERMRTLPHATHAGRRPVFIVGMPRSGTSLVEQILAAHPAVFGAGELENIGQIASELASSDAPYPNSLERLTQAEVNQLADRYLSAISALNSTAQFVTDKMPMNFLHLELIELLLPECHVIHCLRDPLDTCLSCYMTDFTAGSFWAWNQKDLAAYFRGYQRVMDHWKRNLTVRMLEIRYEDIVANLEGQSRGLLEFLKLPWDERCLQFHQSERPVTTASREQVKRPLYGSSVGRWKHYRSHLGELMAELGLG